MLIEEYTRIRISKPLDEDDSHVLSEFKKLAIEVNSPNPFNEIQMESPNSFDGIQITEDQYFHYIMFHNSLKHLVSSRTSIDLD